MFKGYCTYKYYFIVILLWKLQWTYATTNCGMNDCVYVS